MAKVLSTLVEITVKVNVHINNVEAPSIDLAKSMARTLALDTFKGQYPDLANRAVSVDTKVTGTSGVTP
jgi:hypothetical protein